MVLDQEGSNRLGVPTLQPGVSAQESHPAVGLVGQCGALEQRGVGQETVGFQMCARHPALGSFYLSEAIGEQDLGIAQ